MLVQLKHRCKKVAEQYPELEVELLEILGLCYDELEDRNDAESVENEVKSAHKEIDKLIEEIKNEM